MHEQAQSVVRLGVHMPLLTGLLQIIEDMRQLSVGLL